MLDFDDVLLARPVQADSGIVEIAVQDQKIVMLFPITGNEVAKHDPEWTVGIWPGFGRLCEILEVFPAHNFGLRLPLQPDLEVRPEVAPERLAI